jgi:Zn-dependent alcohol dehydrogenase
MVSVVLRLVLASVALLASHSLAQDGGVPAPVPGPPEPTFVQRNWRGTAFGGARGRTDVPKIVDWYMDGKIDIDSLITHVMPVEKINDAFDLMHEGTSIRSVVTF